MPAPIAQNKYSMQVVNNVDLREKMALEFTQALESLSNTPLGALDTFEVFIDNIKFKYRQGDAISIDDTPYSSCTPPLKKQAYDRLEKFMQIAIARYNTQYNL
jgi:hypothetical protein